jgi:hypothetical protein
VGKLNAPGLEDLILGEVYRKAEEANDDVAPKKINAEELEKMKEANFLNFIGKLGQYPQVDIRNFKVKNTDRIVKYGFDVNKTLYVASYDDKQLLKLAKGSIANYSDISPLLPINFTFTIHGISGIKRGDKFGVIGIPKKYDNGFFQVIGVKHTIQGMEWTTEVTGGYRNTKGF